MAESPAPARTATTVAPAPAVPARAPTGELEAISFGKEKPADPGHDEAAWAKNRRADLNYVAR